MANAITADHRRPGRLLYWVVIREVVQPTLFALAVLTALLLVQDVLNYSNLVINRGLGVASVVSIAIYQTVPVIGATLPFSMLLGSLAGLGRLGADRELLAIEACGISSPRLIGPLMTFAAVVSAVSFGLSLYGTPWSARALDDTLERLARIAPAAEIVPGVVQKFGDWKLEAREVSSSGSELRSVLLWMPFMGETAFAKSGTLAPSEGGVRLDLEDVLLVLDPRENTRMLRVEHMSAELYRDDTKIRLGSSHDMRRLSVAELYEQATAGDGSGYLARRSALALQRRFAMPMAPLVFGLLVVPLFLSRAQFSRAGGIVMGLATTLIYYGLIQLGGGLIESERLGIAAGAWLPNVVMAGAAAAIIPLMSRMSAFGRHTSRPSSGDAKAARAATPNRSRSIANKEVEEPAVARANARKGFRQRPRTGSLSRYVATRYAQTALLCFAAIMLGYFLVDLLERMEWFSHNNVTPYEFTLFYAGRLPLIASRVIPMALLVATSLTVSLLAAHGEIDGMRICGIPALRGLAPVLAICALMVPAYFALENLVLPRTNGFYDDTRARIAVKDSDLPYRIPSVWQRSKRFVYEAKDVDPQAGTASEIKVYEMGEDHRPISRTDARSARHVGGGMWRLRDPVRVEVGEYEIRRVVPGPYVRLGDGLHANTSTRRMPIGALRRQADELLEAKLDARPFLVGYHARWAAPLACLLLPAVALMFSLSGPPYPSSAVTAAASVVLALSFVLLTGVSTSLGIGGTLSPIAAAWVPAALMTALATWLGWRLMRAR